MSVENVTKKFSKAVRDFWGKNTLSLLVISGIVFLFLLVATYRLDLPGPYYDELGGPVVTYVYQAIGWRPEPSHLLFGRPILYMGSEYTGALQVNTHQILSLFFDSPLIYRYQPVGWGALTLIVFFYILLQEKEKNISVASLFTLAFAFSPTFMFYARTGMRAIFPRVFFTTLIVYLFLHLLKTKRISILLLLAFVTGFGLSIRLEMAWVIICMAVYSVVFRMDVVKVIFQKKVFPFAFGLFLIGTLPFLLFNVRTGFSSFTRIASNSQVTQYGHSNANFVKNLGRRLDGFVEIMSGRSFAELGAEYFTVVPLIALGLVPIALLSMYYNKITMNERMKFCLTSFLIILPISTFSITQATNPMHLLILYPIVYILIFDTITVLIKDKIAQLVVTMFLVFSNVFTTTQYFSVLLQEKGVGEWSEKMYDLAAWVDENKGSQNIAYLDWGIKHNITFISEGKHYGNDYFGYTPTLTEYPASWSVFLEDPSGYYIFTHGEEHKVFRGRVTLLREYLAPHNLMLREVHSIQENDEDLYIVYEIVPIPNDSSAQ